MRTRLTVVAFLCAATLTGCTDDPGPTATAQSAAPTSAAPSPSPSPSTTYKPAAVGQPFPWRAWQITVDSMRCGTPRDVLGQSNTTDRLADVCAVQFRHVNTGDAPQELIGTDLEFAGYDQQGRAFTGHIWLRGSTNPGVTGNNEMVFDVPSGVRLAAVVIGDTRVPLG